MPLLKVYPYPNGRIDANYREGAQPPVDDGWWRDVLHDRRARISDEGHLRADDPDARYRLDRQGLVVSFCCMGCRWRRDFTQAELLKAHAPDSNVMLLARDLANCGGHTRDGDACLAFCLR